MNASQTNSMISTRYNINLPFYLLLATISSFIISIFIFQVFAGLLVFIWLFERNNDKLKTLDATTYLFISFVIIRILTALLSEFPESSIRLFYKDALFFLSFFAFSYYLKIFINGKFRVIFYTLVIAAMVVAGIGVVRFLLGDVHRAESFTSGYSTYSSYLVSLLGFAILLFGSLKVQKQKIFWAIGIIIMLSGIVTSLGRTNIVIAVLIFIAGIIMAKVKLRYIISVILVVAGLTWISFQLNTGEINQRIETPAHLSDRDIILEAAGELFLKFEHPVLGFGPRTFHDIFAKKDLLSDKGVGSWHNDFIQVYFESGFAGLIILLLLIIYPFFIGINCLMRCELDEDRKMILFGALLGEAALVLSALTAGFVNSPVLSVFFAFLISTISAITTSAQAAQEEELN